MSSISLLLVCLQGVYKKGRFLCEYPADNGVHLSHLLGIAELAKKFRNSHVVLSGGPTQPRAPGISESTSAKGFLEQKDSLPCPRGSLLVDESALDTAQNIVMGLATLRLAVGWQLPIREVVVSICWGPKRRRVDAVTSLLGISDRVHVVPHDWDGSLAFSPDALRAGEAKFVEESEDDVLLLGPKWEAKRRQRWHGSGSYESRLDHFLAHQRIRPWFDLIGSVSHTNDISKDQLQQVFGKAIGPFS